ncbi:F169A protein, partial [Alectura lathami]|nr:F169A protein [Alectura lathami]
MAFPVDLLDGYNYEDLSRAAEVYMCELRDGDPNRPDYFYLSDNTRIPITLSSVGFVPLFGEDVTHKILALFAPEDSLKAVALYLAYRWWSFDDILRTSESSRDGLLQVKSVGERIVLYVLNRFIYRKTEMGQNDIPFLCHSRNDYAKIMWKQGEAVGFYSVKPAGASYSPRVPYSYQLTVLDTMFVRKKHREKDIGVTMLEDFANTFASDNLGLRYPMPSVMYTACKHYNEKYRGDHNILWEVEGPGFWFQRKSIRAVLEMEHLRFGADSSLETDFQESEESSEVTEEQPNTETQSTVGTQTVTDYSRVALISLRTRVCNLKRPRIGRSSQEPRLVKYRRTDESIPPVSLGRVYINTCCRPERLLQKCKLFEVIVEESEEAESDEEIVVQGGQSVLETELHLSSSEKQSENEETSSEPSEKEKLAAGETDVTSVTDEEKTASDILVGESKLQSESQGEDCLTQLVPLTVESTAEISEDATLDKVLNADDSEAPTEESTSVEKDTEKYQQEFEKKKSSTENATASAPKGGPSTSVTEAVEESISKDLLSKTVPTMEDQNEEAEQSSQEAPAGTGQSSSTAVELEGVSFQQASGQEGRKNETEENLEEPAEKIDQYMQVTADRAADSSSEEAEVEVPVVDRRNLRRKAKGCKGPAKKKGKPA